MQLNQSGGVRPFGVSILFAGYDDDGPQLYQIDPSGSYFGWKATAIGKGAVSAKTFLEKVIDNCHVGQQDHLTERLFDSAITTIQRLKMPSTQPY